MSYLRLFSEMSFAHSLIPSILKRQDFAADTLNFNRIYTDVAKAVLDVGSES